MWSKTAPKTPSRRYSAATIGSALCLTMLLAPVLLPSVFNNTPQANAQSPAAETEAKPLYLSDPATFRRQAVKQKVLDVFKTKPTYTEDDTPLSLMPEGTTPITVVNPGFDFTYDNGTAPDRDYWIIVLQEGQPAPINGAGKGKITDPIQGWTSKICAGMESGRPVFFTTQPDGSTGYAISTEGAPEYCMFQTIKGALKPNTRYTMLVEVFKRKSYGRATADEIIMRLSDGEGKPLDVSDAEYHLTPADKTTGYSVCLITLVTHADQVPGDLKIDLGMKAEGSKRFNFDNVLLFEQAME